MISLRYSYLLMDLGYLLIWVAIFFFRKDLRTILLVSSLPLGFVGLALNRLYIHDWWNPQTLSGTIPAVEDFLYGFGIGLSSVVAHVVLRTTPTYVIELRDRSPRRHIGFVLVFIAGTALYYFFHNVFGLHGIKTSLLILVLGLCIILGRRPYLAFHALVAGLAFTAVSSLVYACVTYFTPDWIEFWCFDLFPRTIILALPLEDIVFYFFFGAAFGTFYHGWYGVRIKKLGE